MELRKKSETTGTITLEWTPPNGVEYYLFYAGGIRVSNAPPTNILGQVKTSIKFDKARAPFEVVAITRTYNGVMGFDIGKYRLQSLLEETQIGGLRAISQPEE